MRSSISKIWFILILVSCEAFGQPGILTKRDYSINQANFIVTDSITFRKAIDSINVIRKTSYARQIIWINGTINITGKDSLLRPPANTVICGNGTGLSTITSTKGYAELNYRAMVAVTQNDVEINGIIFKGASPEIGEPDPLYQTAIRITADRTRIKNCSFRGFNYMGVWIYRGDSNVIEHCDISFCRGYGYGYGVWVTNNDLNKIARIDSNIFNNNRNAIASSGHYSSWSAQGNVVWGIESYYAFDRHNISGTCCGGKNTILNGNYFIGLSYGSVGFPRPIDGGEIEITNNHFTYSHGVIDDSIIDFIRDTTGFGLFVNDNSPYSYIQPFFKIDSLSPTKYKFTTTPNVLYRTFTKGTDPFGTEYTSKTLTATFPPGITEVEATAFTTGIPATAYIKIQTPGNSVWVKDSYDKITKGKGRKEIWVNHKKIWSDDISSPEGWQMIKLPDTTRELNIKFYNTDTVRHWYLVDDGQVKGFKNCDFEQRSLGWGYGASNNDQSVQYYSGASRSGRQCMQVRLEPGGWVDICQ